MQTRDVKAGAIGAALSALAFVAVYEGKVAVSHASERAELGAGESAQVGADGVKKSTALGDGQKEFDQKLSEGEPLGAANENLVSQVSDYKKRLEAIASQKTELEKKLKASEERLAAAQADGAVPPSKPEFDLGTDEWKELAKDGTMKMQIPCVRPGGWSPKAEQLQAIGLAPHDGPVLKNAYLHSNQRLWGVVRPLCATALGGNAE